MEMRIPTPCSFQGRDNYISSQCSCWCGICCLRFYMWKLSTGVLKAVSLEVFVKAQIVLGIQSPNVRGWLGGPITSSATYLGSITSLSIPRRCLDPQKWLDSQNRSILGSYCWWFRNLANQLRPSIYRVSYDIPRCCSTIWISFKITSEAMNVNFLNKEITLLES